MSEKIRFYLEQSVEELNDLKNRGIFNESELRTIMKRRTDYEHKIAARTVKPSEFKAYATYEINLDKLRSIRLKRLRKKDPNAKKGVSDTAGSRRITFIFQRATKRFPANLDLWIALVEFAKQQKAFHITSKALVSMLRLHPTKPEVWVYVAKYQAEEASAIQEARAVLQRGLRFNRDSLYLWLEYMRLELIYVAKIHARRKLLGLERAHKVEQRENSKSESLDLDQKSLSDQNEVAEKLENLPEINVDILGDVTNNPALRGDVALAVYDAAAGTLNQNQHVSFAHSSLEIIDEFKTLDRDYLCTHIIKSLIDNPVYKPQPSLWAVTLPVRYCKVDSPEFPDRLRQVFGLYSKYKADPELAEALRGLLLEKVPEDSNEALHKAVTRFVSNI